MGRPQQHDDAAMRSRLWLWRLLGPALMLAVLALHPASIPAPAAAVLAAALWMALWWVSEAAPLAVTSLLPLLLFPLLGVRGVREVAPNYAGHMIFLFFGGFVLALAVEKSGLHKRVALWTLALIGGSLQRLVWAFLVASADLSMWLSNTATALMLLPVALAVVDRVDDYRAGTRILLALAFGSSIGGIGTLVGTPPNLVLAGMSTDLVSGLEPLSFGTWMLFGVPLVVTLLPLAGLLLARSLPREQQVGDLIETERKALGPMAAAEKRVAVLFGLTAGAWVTRSGIGFGQLSLPGWAALLPNPEMVSDAVPAVAAAVAAVLIPRRRGSRRALLGWQEIQSGVPWGILLLFGGGFALADGVHASRLDLWLAAGLQGLGEVPFPLLILAVVSLSVLITNLSSNTATATLLMPVMAALATALDAPPYLLMSAATVAASCAFVLPVATPPNAIVMGSGRVSARDLFREGLMLNAVAVVVVTLLCLLLGPLVLPAVR